MKATGTKDGLSAACGGAALAEALNRGDLEAAADCFCADARLVTPDATTVCGREGISLLLAQLVAVETRVIVERSEAARGLDSALVSERWTVSSRGAEGRELRRTLSPLLVLRRLEERWKLSIAEPWRTPGALPSPGRRAATPRTRSG
jgi:ketosteroid isomerase-like protein